MNTVYRQQLQTFFFVTVAAFFAVGCNQRKTPKESAAKNIALCSCKQSVEELGRYFTIDAKNDSVIICSKATITFFDNKKKKTASYVEFLKKNTLALDRRIWDCDKDAELKFKFYDNSISYKDKHLVVYSNKMYYYYNSKSKLLDRIMFLPTYSQNVYAKGGVLIITQPELILKPEPIPLAAIKIIHKKFEQLVRTNPYNYQAQLADLLLMAALSGDRLSEERLRNFTKYFRVRDDNQHLLDDNLTILTDFQRLRKK
jgi:hypothetical protein